jgi:zinc protease
MGLLVSTKTPDYLADREMRRVLYGSHPYSRTVTGELDDLSNLTTDDLRAWWKANLRPDNAILYVAGDISAKAAFALAKKHFGAWKVEGKLSTPTLAAMPASGTMRIYLVDDPSSVQSQIRVGHRSIQRNDPSYFASRVLDNIFGGGFNSRLNRAIRVEKGLTYGARGGIAPSRFAGQFTISTFTKTPTTAETVRVILDEIGKIRSEQVTDEELRDTKTFITGRFAGDRETAGATVGDLWMIETEGLPEDYLQRYLKGVGTTTAADVLAAAKDLIRPEELAIVVVGKASEVKASLEEIAPVTLVGGGGEETGEPVASMNVE